VEAVPSLSKSDDARGWTDGRMPDARKSNEELAIEVPVSSCLPVWSPNSENPAMEIMEPWSVVSQSHVMQEEFASIQAFC